MCGIFPTTISIPYNPSPVQPISHTMPFPRAVIFDLDNTLHSLIAARLTAISTVAAWLNDATGDLPYLFLHNDKPTMVEDVLTRYLTDTDNLAALTAEGWLYHTARTPRPPRLLGTGRPPRTLRHQKPRPRSLPETPRPAGS